MFRFKSGLFEPRVYRDLGDLGGLTDIVDPLDITGRRGQEEAVEKATGQQVEFAGKAIERQEQAKQQALGLLGAGDSLGLLGAGADVSQLQPFAELGQSAISQAGILTDPQQQIDFLQSNPLFQLALENANRQTLQGAAAGGRLAAGDTLQQLTGNVLLQAQPLLAQQQANVSDLLGLGVGTARDLAQFDLSGRQSAAQLDLAQRQAAANAALGVGSNISNLLTGIGSSLSAGTIGQQRAQQQGIQNLVNLGATGAGFSDERLKDNITFIEKENGYNKYSWTWNEIAEGYGLKGPSFGVIAQEVAETRPDAIITNDEGFLMVDYEKLGVSHG